MVLVGNTSGGLFLSKDCVNWFSVDSKFGSSSIFCSDFYNGLYVIGGANGKIATSVDGRTWTLRNSTFGSATVQEVHCKTGIFVAVSGTGSVATSDIGYNTTTSFAVPYVSSFGAPGYFRAN